MGVDMLAEPRAKFRQGKAQEIIAEVLRTKVRNHLLLQLASRRLRMVRVGGLGPFQSRNRHRVAPR